MLPSPDSLSCFLAAATPSGFAQVWDFLSTGGFVMLLIVLCSFASVTVMITAYLQLREKCVLPRNIISELKSMPTYAERGDIRPLQNLLENDPSTLAQLGAMAISGRYSSRLECQEAIAARAKEELHQLERGIPVLEMMVTVAPLLGLLGTTAALVGMFSAFGEGAESGPDTAAVAHEIGVALRCTIAGLFVAVPSVLAHTYFVRRLDAIAVRLEALLQDAIHAFFSHFEVQRTSES
ncbi:MAG TPA: MotA/TolQ/ExbB proton channel family protein [Prosthecobacter sp.]|nr:MotA/TolQ/ExbB proton channel family protein [Prosthecobacter sp.]